ncbi:uncharacterized protein LOC122654335 isoform X2 [Telopea speciosissima]|uniref:uncharacterized protein LOC122654335 isoform X2 n=1 Tax=Telopea speciosissima TaxID=54955 RepID=UPI001CC79C90|nr:uncharacterized protein LOC122654335 isoform X2 [Telopea speciosissima]
MENPETLADGGVASESAKAQTMVEETIKVESGVDGGVASESAKAQTLEEETIKVESRVTNETLTGHLPSDVRGDGIQENGIRVSINNMEGIGGDATTRMEGVTSVLDKETDGTGIGYAVLDDGSRVAAVELQENGKEFGFPDENDKKIVEGNVSVTVVESGSAMNENKESSVPQILPEIVLNGDVSIELNGGDSTTKIEVSGDGVPLVVEIHGSCEAYEKSCGVNNTVLKPEGGLLAENGENPDDKFSGKYVPMVETEKINGVEDKEEKEVDGGEEQEEVYDQEHEFSVGDFVWGKIKSHPWWPGQIYDPSDASKYAAKCRRRDRLLVAYFGDGTFAWCHPSQLKPFKENFELMWNQSNSKSFVNAVQVAVDEIGRRVELEMTCACVPEEIRNRFARPLAVNAGIKEGVSVPDGGIGELTITRYEPAKFLAQLSDVAEVVSVNSILEHKVLCSCLSAFYRAKGYRQLPMYYEADGIASTEDSAVNEEMCKSILDGQEGELNLHPAEVEWLSSPVDPEIGKYCKISSQRWPGSSDDKLYQRKKQKSMAELLAGDVDVDHRRSESDTAGEVISGKPASTSKKRKKKDYEDGINVAKDSGGNNKGLQTKKLKKRKLSVSIPTAEEKFSDIDNDEGADEASLMSSSPRVRKKSKYLSPPYTDLSRGKSLNSPNVSQTVSPKAYKVSSIVECIRRDADQLTGTPPVIRCSGQTFQKKPSKESGAQRKTYGNLSPRTLNSGNYKNSFMEGNAFMDEMFSDFLTIALDPFYLTGMQRFDTFKSFFSRFRSSVYHNKSKFKTDNEQLAVRGSRKRKSLESNPGSSGQDSHATDRPSSEPKSKRKSGEMEKAFPQNPRNELPQVDGTSGLQTDHSREETKDESSAASALLLIFAPGISLPLKDDLITIFGRFGALNEKETDVLKDSNCARVAFVRSSDAVEAFNSSQKVSPFGQAVVNYRLRYSSAISGASERDESSHLQPTPLPVEGNEPSANPAASRLSAISGASGLDESSHLQPTPLPTEGNEPSANPSASRLTAGDTAPLDFIKQNLEIMTSVLENSGEKILPGVKENLEGDIKGLLKKLSTMDDSSSS